MKSMNALWKKTIVLGTIALFLGMTLAPGISAIPPEENEKTNKLRQMDTLIKEEKQTIEPIQTESNNIFSNLKTLISDLKTEQPDFDNIRELINWLINRTDAPVITYLLSELMDSQRLEGREIILSFGWNYDINPFKKNQFKILKPLTLWRYSEQSDMMNIPSTTIIISRNPVAIENVMGNQIGLMYRFRGVFGHVPDQLPQKSITYMVGSAKAVTAIELPTMNLF